MTSYDLHQTPRQQGKTPQNVTMWLWISGLASVLLGFVAVIFPLAATLAAELLFEAVLAALGVVQIFSALFARTSRNRLWTIFFGLAALFAGVLLLVYPLLGAVTLTIVLALFFVVGGTLQIISAWYLRPGNQSGAGIRTVDGWGWMTLWGALSIFLGGILLSGLPVTAVWALGLLLGLDLMLLGVAEIVFAQALRRAG